MGWNRWWVRVRQRGFVPLWLVGQAGEVRGESSYSELGSVIVWLRKGLGSGGEGLVFFMVEVLV